MDIRKQKMALFLLAIAAIIAIGVYLTSTTYSNLSCVETNQSYTVLEPYTVYDYQTVWSGVYEQILDKVNVNIPSNRPNFVSYYLCSPCRYNVTFISDKPTNFFVFDDYNYQRYFQYRSAFAISQGISSANSTLSFEVDKKGKYYFVFDRSAQGTNTNDPATGRLLLNESLGSNQTTQIAKYREVVKYRNATVCE
jgi:hypothetical protein